MISCDIVGGVFGLAPNDLQIIKPPEKEEDGVSAKQIGGEGGGGGDAKGVKVVDNHASVMNDQDKAEKLGINNGDNGLSSFKTNANTTPSESVPPSMNTRY